MCERCGASFYVSTTDLGKGSGRHCSDACRRQHQAANTPEYLKRGRVPVHRIVAAKKLGRPLLPGETVHHADGDRHNNAPENLIVFPSQSAHMKAEGHGFAQQTHEQHVAAGKRSVEVRRARKAAHSNPSSPN